MAADLARRGFTAQESIFDGDHSFQRLYGSEVDAAAIVDKLGRPWDVVEPGMNFKRWPCCYCTHRPLGGLIEMMAREKLAAGDIEEVRSIPSPRCSSTAASTSQASPTKPCGARRRGP